MKIEEPSHQNADRASFHALLELGFRPLYLCGALWALIGVGFWIFTPHLLGSQLNGMFWHAHEMLWGFIPVIAIGFLLTATNNWTGINPLRGTPLAVLTLLWLTARIFFLIPNSTAYIIATACEITVFIVASLSIGRALLKSKSRNNYSLPILLVGMGITDAFYLWSIWNGLDYNELLHYLLLGILYMLSITLLLARRVIPFFASRAIDGVSFPRCTHSGQYQVAFTALAIATWLFELNTPSALLLTGAGFIALWHLITWKPWKVLHIPLLWILYAGYTGLAVGILTTALYAAGWITQISWPIHIIAVAGFSPLILGMMTRTALGHTGHMLRTDKAMRMSFYILLLSGVLRIFAISIDSSSLIWLHSSATAWIIAFAIYLYRFIPILTRPRCDQKTGKPISLRRS